MKAMGNEMEQKPSAGLEPGLFVACVALELCISEYIAES